MCLRKSRYLKFRRARSQCVVLHTLVLIKSTYVLMHSCSYVLLVWIIVGTKPSGRTLDLYIWTTSRLVPSPGATPTRFLFGRPKEDALYGFSIAGIQILVFSITFSSVFRIRNQHWPLLWLGIFNFESSSPLNPQMKFNSFRLLAFLWWMPHFTLAFCASPLTFFFFLISASCLSISFQKVAHSCWPTSYRYRPLPEW